MQGKLERTLGLRDLIGIVIGAVIGSGIFIVPATVLQQTGGDPDLALGVWVVAGILSLLGALTYGELGAMKPEAGGMYVYIRDAFGSFLAFLFGWTLFFVIASGAMATLSDAFTAYLGQLMPLSETSGKIAALLMILVIALLNVYGTRRSANVQNLTSVIKVSAVVLMSVALLAAGRAAPDATAAPIEAPASLFTAAGIALLGVLWAYEGWQYSTFSAGETTRPQRTFPLGITIGMIVLIGVYCLANVAYVAALGPENAAASDRIAATAVNAAFGPTAARLITIAILISIYSAANSLALTAPRVFYAMAGDGLFFKQLARVSPRFGTPAISIVALCAWAMVLSLSGTFEQLLTYVVFTGWLFYALGAASIFVYRTRQPDAPRPFRVPGYPLTPALFVIAGCAIVVNALFARTEPALTGIAIVLTGAPAYMIWRYLLRRTPPSAERPTETVAAGDSGRRAGH